MTPDKKAHRGKSAKAVRLKDVANHVGLSTAAVSTVLNRSPAAESIPEATKQRIFEAAKDLGYRPNYLARSLRSQRSQTVGVLVPEISEGYAAGVLGGVEIGLAEHGYFYLVTSHRSDPERLARYQTMLADRAVEGFVLVNTPLDQPPPLPAVAIAGHKTLQGVTNVAVDHRHAAELALSHLAELGHRKLAVFRGHPSSADTQDRWQTTLEVAEEKGLIVSEQATIELGTEIAGRRYRPEEGFEEGYAAGKALLAQSRDYTALMAFNDVSAIGAMRAFRDSGLDVPNDISTIGFDDIPEAAFHIPSLTTVRQPLREMGRIAGELLVQRLNGAVVESATVTVEPELIVRESTGPPRAE